MFLVIAGVSLLTFLIGLIRLIRKKKVIIFLIGLLLAGLCIYLYISSVQLKKNKSLSDERSSLHWYITYQNNYMGGVQQDIYSRVENYNKSVEPYNMKWQLCSKLMPWLKCNYGYLEVNGVTPGVDGKKNPIVSVIDTVSGFFNKNKDSMSVSNMKEMRDSDTWTNVVQGNDGVSATVNQHTQSNPEVQGNVQPNENLGVAQGENSGINITTTDNAYIP